MPERTPSRSCARALGEELRQATGATKLPALKLPDGTVITRSRAILKWAAEQA